MLENAKKFLKPAFDAVSKPGLGNPHTPYEAELMAKGAKPVAILGQSSIDQELQEAIENGQIIHIDSHEFESTFRIYCHPSQIESATRAADIYTQAMQSGDGIRQDDQEFLEKLHTSPVEDSANSSPLGRIADQIRNGLGNIVLDPESEAVRLGKGHIKAMRPLHVADLELDPDNKQKLETAVEEGEIAFVEYNATSVLNVFAQASHEAQGHELNARYYGDPDTAGYESLNPVESAKRIGELLGYTENDQSWFAGTKYTNPLINQIMTMTSDVRRWARKESMLMNAQETRTIAGPDGVS